MTNSLIQTLYALYVMLVNTAQQVHRIAVMYVLLVIGVLVGLVMTILQEMHVLLVVIQKERE